MVEESEQEPLRELPAAADHRSAEEIRRDIVELLYTLSDQAVVSSIQVECRICKEDVTNNTC